MSYETLKSNLMYKGKIFDIYQDEITLPNNETAIREYVRRGDAAAVVAADEEGKLFFVRQYRHPIKALSLEIPAGVLEKGEDPAVAALRELEEEIGYKSLEPLVLLSSVVASIGICDEKVHIYLVKSLVPGKQNFDADEFIEVEKYTLDEAI